MKNASFYFATTIMLLFGFQVSLSAQKTATWKGGTPGRNTDWDCSSNWKEGRVPDEFSYVVIPDVSTSTFYYPVIEHDVEIQSLSCVAPAMIKMRNDAQVIILQTGMDETSVQKDSFAQTGRRLVSGKTTQK